MTIYAKANPVGLDAKIHRVQQKLSDWLEWENIDIYGRLYVEKNDKNEKVALAYLSSGEYSEIFFDDKKAAVFGFFVSDTRNGVNMTEVPVELVCSCNLNALYDTTERMDEEVLTEVSRIIKFITLRPNERNIKTGLDNVFSRIDTNRIRFRDMHPWFNFSIGFDLVYKT